MDIEEIIGMKIIKEVKVGLEKDCIQVTLEGMTGVVAIVGQCQDQEQVLIEAELGVMSVGSSIISQNIVLQQPREERQNKYSRCLI